MQERPDHPAGLDRGEPTWTVQSVFDPDGGGKDFAYTIGLEDRGCPELHVWARPSLGEDPGDDWMLSPTDRCRLLNELAWRLVDGRLDVGAEVTRTYDDGETVVHCRVDPPGDRAELEAFGIGPAAVVLPVRWSLTRPPDGRPRALGPHERRRAQATRRKALSSLDRAHPGAPNGWKIAGRAVWGRDQLYGPLTPVVLGRAAQLWQADLTSMNCLLRAAADVAAATSSLTLPVSLSVAAARRAGRRHQMARLLEDVSRLVETMTGAEPWRRRWEAVGRSLWGAEIMDDPELALRASRSDRSLMLETTLSCLAAEAVADVVDPETLLQARGPWNAGLAPTHDVPRELQASPDVVAVLTGVLKPLSADQLGGIACLHRWACEGRVEEWAEYPELASRLRGWALVGPAGCSWHGVLDTLPGWQPVLRGIAGGAVHVDLAPQPELHEWATLVTSALCHRHHLSADDVSLLASPYVDLLPGLDAILNAPIVRADPADPEA